MTSSTDKITITDIPAFEDGFRATLLESTLANVDAEFSPEHIAAARRVIYGMVNVVAIVQQSTRSEIDVETFVALMASACMHEASELTRLAGRAAILDRLVDAGYVTETLVDDIEAKLESEATS